jgi:hypothetical protein
MYSTRDVSEARSGISFKLLKNTAGKKKENFSAVNKYMLRSFLFCKIRLIINHSTI